MLATRSNTPNYQRERGGREGGGREEGGREREKKGRMRMEERREKEGDKERRTKLEMEKKLTSKESQRLQSSWKHWSCLGSRSNMKRTEMASRRAEVRSSSNPGDDWGIHAGQIGIYMYVGTVG